MNLNDKKVALVELFNSKKKEVNLKGWILYFSNHYRGSIGMCYNDEKKIRLSNIWIEALEIKEMKQALLHEIAHALSSTGHNNDWYKQCLKLGMKNPQVYYMVSLQANIKLQNVVHKRIK